MAEGPEASTLLPSLVTVPSPVPDASGCSSLWSQARDDFLAYVNEYRCTLTDIFIHYEGGFRLYTEWRHGSRAQLHTKYSYLGVYFPCFIHVLLTGCPTQSAVLPTTDSSFESSVIASLASTDVVIYSLPGCGFCERAKDAITATAAATPFSYAVVDGSSVDAYQALQRVTRQASLTFPVVFVRGYYLGGADQLDDLITADQFATVLARPKV
jgi:glutaredoxin